MSKIIDAVVKEVEAFNDSIRDDLDSKKITNTGEAAKSLRIEFGDDFVRSIGIFYLEFLDTGRGPGKAPPDAPIRKWLKTKYGLSGDELDIAVRRVQIRIAQLGTLIFRDNKKGIELTKKIVSLRENINKEVVSAAKIEVIQVLDRFKKKYKFNLS